MILGDVSVSVIALLSIVLSTAITTAVAFIIKRNLERFYTKREKADLEYREKLEKLAKFEREDAIEKQQQMIKEVLEEFTAPIFKDLEVLKKGTQAGLRHDLYLIADEWISKGYCPRAVKTDFENLYTQYHILGKNGVMDSTYQSLLSLPENTPEPRGVKLKPKKTQMSKESRIPAQE